MIDGYVTVKEKAEQWGVSIRTLQMLCAKGKIKGAIKFGTSWAIPRSIERPADGRIVTGKYIGTRKK